MTSPGKRVPVAADRRALQPYLRVQRVADKRLLDEMAASLRDAERQLARLAGQEGIGAAVRRDQVRGVILALRSGIEDTWRRVLVVTFATRGDAAAAAVQSQLPYETDIFKRAGAQSEFKLYRESLEAQSKAGIDSMRTRLSVSRIELSQNVYHAKALSLGKVDRIVNSALSRGLSARELAADVRQYIQPGVRGGIRYAAMRLARTELNNSFHAQQAQLAIEKPWVEASRWNLSSSHPKPDNCDDYAGRSHFKGGGPGEWKPEDVPGKPHPHCLCFLTPVLVPEDEFLAAMNSGKYTDYMNRTIQ